ncbi:D-arabinose 1-dehydrogenase-like Zn-dependent alcohol dehydrogenase [Pseudorhizobium tarimense]|uniref:D-arabinose 1-dehydrogenase-like Zn-dependent alcohol dehydrogenase n=1 Tax=Pseudorhizobium tarimense TaxID=1079109 RepID=A0ABV2HC71_9HYPH
MGDQQALDSARRLGVAWGGFSGHLPPEPLDAAIIVAPFGELVPEALKVVRRGGRVICGGIHMSDIPQMPYALLWGERSISSVAT